MPQIAKCLILQTFKRNFIFLTLISGGNGKSMWFRGHLHKTRNKIYPKRNFNPPQQRIIQEFNLGVGSHVSITLWCELYSWGVWGRRGRGHGCCNPPLLILLYITTWLYILIYTILLYILFFKTIIFFPKFNFLASYNSSFLKSNLAVFWV